MECKKLEELLKAARGHHLSPAERDAQRNSWAKGELMLEHPDMTEEEAEKLVAAASGVPFRKPWAFTFPTGSRLWEPFTSDGGFTRLTTEGEWTEKQVYYIPPGTKFLVEALAVLFEVGPEGLYSLHWPHDFRDPDKPEDSIRYQLVNDSPRHHENISIVGGKIIDERRAPGA